MKIFEDYFSKSFLISKNIILMVEILHIFKINIKDVIK